MKTRKSLREIVFNTHSTGESKLPSLDLPSQSPEGSPVTVSADNNNSIMPSSPPPTTTMMTMTVVLNCSQDGSNNNTNTNGAIGATTDSNHQQQITSIQFNSMQAIVDHIGNDDEDSNTDSSSTTNNSNCQQLHHAVGTKSNPSFISGHNNNRHNQSPPSSPQQLSSPKSLSNLLKLAFGPRKKSSKTSSPSSTTTTPTSPPTTTILDAHSASADDLYRGSGDHTAASSSVSTSAIQQEIKKKKKKKDPNQTPAHIDLNDYQFSYEKVISNSETSQEFLKFLTMKKTSESLLFILKFRELKTKFQNQTNCSSSSINSSVSHLGNSFVMNRNSTTTTTNSSTNEYSNVLEEHSNHNNNHHNHNYNQSSHYRNTLKTIEELYKLFFAFDSPMELNLPLNLHEPTTKIMEEYEAKKVNDPKFCLTEEKNNQNGNGQPLSEGVPSDESSSSSSSPLLSIITSILNEFKKIESYLNLNLKECQFLEFLEWDKFRKFITGSKGLIHLSQVAELKPYSHSSFVESLVSEMSKPRITVKQAKQIKHLVLKNTSIWSPIITESNYIVSLSNNQYLLGEEESNSSNNKGVYFFKYDITFPYPKQTVINTLLNTKLRFKFDKNTKMLSKIDYFPKEDNENLATCVTQEVYEFPFPFQSREMVLACSMLNDSTDNSTMLCLRSCESDKTVKLKKTVKAKNVGCWIFQDLNGTHTRYVQFVGADFKGLLPPKIVTKNVAKRAKYYYADSLKMFENPQDNDQTELELENDPLFSGFMNTLKENGNVAI